MPTEPRAQHPFYMHEAILKQPEGFAHAVRRVIEQLATSISSCERLFLVGIATSYSN
ncbi:MAG: glutamine--fructose-6-phosphate aminotransferase, partial [Cyanobacteria bacterium QS_1_48_34]